MLSLLDNWDYTTKGLARICKDGVDSICAAVRELEEHGYVIRERVRGANGQLGSIEYTILEQPAEPSPEGENPVQVKPILENPVLGKPEQENPAQSNKDNPDIINPINQSGGTDEMEYITKIKEECSAYAQIVWDNTDYELLIEQNPGKADTINELISIMVDAICSTRPTIRVNGEDIPHDVVKSTFLKLNSSHIEYVLEAMDNNTSDVRNIRSYLITALYNSRLTLNSY